MMFTRDGFIEVRTAPRHAWLNPREGVRGRVICVSSPSTQANCSGCCCSGSSSRASCLTIGTLRCISFVWPATNSGQRDDECLHFSATITTNHYGVRTTVCFSSFRQRSSQAGRRGREGWRKAQRGTMLWTNGVNKILQLACYTLGVAGQLTRSVPSTSASSACRARKR